MQAAHQVVTDNHCLIDSPLLAIVGMVHADYLTVGGSAYDLS